MTVYGIGGDYIPLLFFKFVLIFMKKLTHVGSEYSRNILKIIFLFLDDHLFFIKFIIILDIPLCIITNQIIL